MGSFFDNYSSIFPKELSVNDGRIKFIKEYLKELPTNFSLLDAGCGNGRILHALQTIFPSIQCSGIDISPKMLSYCSSSIHTQVANCESIPHKDNSFDAVICVEVLEHVLEIEPSIQEMTRVLKPGGVIIIIDKNIEKLGSLRIEKWEQWFSKEQIKNLLEKDFQQINATFIQHDQLEEPDEIFIAWKANKI